MEKILCLLLTIVPVFSSEQRICIQPGVNTNPNDSGSFIICSEVGNSTSVTKVVRCPENYVFSSEERTCVKERKRAHPRVSRATSGTSICNVSGPVCASCDLMVVCAEMGGKMIPLTNVSCSDTSPDNICDAKTRSCRRATSDSACHPAPAFSTFRCIQPGFFPDPSDCKKYHICDDSLVHYEDSCDVAYDPILATCTDNVTCTVQASTSCTSDELPKPIPSNAGFYSVCIPAIIRSPSGEVKVNYQTAVLQCPDHKQFIYATSTCEMVCTKRPDQIPDPEDCHSYYDCPANKEASSPPVKRTCPSNLAYDSIKRICSLESRVAACRAHSITTRDVNDEQVPAPNSTTATPQSSSTITRAVTGTSVTTNITPQTTTPAATPNRCTEMSVLQDSTNCYRYYQCVGGRLVRRQCPFFFYFNPNYQACVLGLFCSFRTY